MNAEQQACVESAQRMVGILLGIREYTDTGVFNHEGAEELGRLGADLSQVMPDLAAHVRARKSIPEFWLNTDTAPWRGERFEEAEEAS